MKEKKDAVLSLRTTATFAEQVDTFAARLNCKRGELIEQALTVFITAKQEGRIPETQKKAYRSLIDLAKRQRHCYDLIRDQADGATLHELVKLSGLPVNHISGRITELKDAGHIYCKDNEVRVNPATMRPARVWRAKRRAK